MKNNDDMLTRQGDVYTLVDKDGCLIREDINGDRKKYLLEGEGDGGGAELPENIVNTVNGQTGDVTLDIPELPANIVNTFNGLSGDINWPELVLQANSSISTTQINFTGSAYMGKITYFKTPVPKVAIIYPAVSSSNVKYMKDKYAIVKTSDTFTGPTVNFRNPTEDGYPEWITNKEFVMEPNKTYLIGCNYPLATIEELEKEDELDDVIDAKVNAKFEEYANKEW